MSKSKIVKSCLICKYSTDHPIWVWSCEHPDDSITSDVEISDPSQMTEEVAQEWAKDCPGYTSLPTRRELRPQGENKLKLASMTGDNPGFEFLSQCWDDVALWNRVKQLIA
ncbi:MAG: hypothetical protein RMY64_26110 [Nostoc sp. DedQUE08]|uniref:hypothetical protein n=1 Tax=Nostoc sp. DedQUE08 TaxID=3075393 RepID=UPI002AD3A497|nr:hypothetical protein [Nostoc sp. DedQUE08]MDZ8069046.1 hypothetical protein [Nostoc sp. DedQUE08]